MNIVRFVSGLLHFDRTNWKAVSLCVLTATVFWIFNSFNKSHSTTIQFPLTFEYNRDRVAPVHDLPQKISINVTGNGWDLFTKNFGFKLPHLVIVLERPTEIKKIVCAGLVPMFSSQMGSLHINHILTDTLRLQLDLRDKHTYKLVADISKVTFEKGYGRVSPVVILPDSISMDGPQSLLHELPDSITVKVKAEDIHSNFKSEVGIEIRENDFITRKPSVAKIIFEVGRVEEVQKKIPLVTKNSKDSIVVWFQVPIDKLSDFKIESVEMVATIKNTKLQLSHLPRYAVLLKTDSVK